MVSNALCMATIYQLAVSWPTLKENDQYLRMVRINSINFINVMKLITPTTS